MSDLEFVNRGEELRALRELLSRKGRQASQVIVLRSPAGFGKSRLTDQLVRSSQTIGLNFCVVEPEIQGAVGSVRLHDGYFLQRCAESLVALADSPDGIKPTFQEFLRERQWKTLKDKPGRDLISEAPSWKNLYNIALDYTSRVFSFGNFSPQKLLYSDQSEAVRICEEYAESTLTSNQIVLVLREMQHCDNSSFRTLLRWSQSLINLDLIIEYTSPVGRFEASHEKMFDRLPDDPVNIKVWDIKKLNYDHLEYLIRTNVGSECSVAMDAYACWDGNLRSVMEMKFQVGVIQQVTRPEQLRLVLTNYPSVLDEHIRGLTSNHRMILALCMANLEPIREHVLAHVLISQSKAWSPLSIKKALDELIDTHKFILKRGSMYAIHNENVAIALGHTITLRPMLASCEKHLRDYYSNLLGESQIEDVELAVAVRQVFRLCARTKDVVGLLRATSILSREVAHAKDPSMYVEVVASAIEADPTLYDEYYGEFIVWAASLAYEIGNYHKAESMLSLLTNPSSQFQITRAFCLQEIGRHDEALALAEAIRTNGTHRDHVIAADLLEALIWGCRGDLENARLKLSNVVLNSENSESPLLGYAFRFFEPITDYTGCIDYLEQSILCFEKKHLTRSKAYSQAAAAVLVARHGKIQRARELISDAARTLGADLRDRHLMLNNVAAIELLSEQPNAEMCIYLLSDALRHVNDDYSEISVMSNLSLAYWEAGQFERAAECNARVLQILHDHDFVDSEIYWPICLNASLVYRSNGEDKEAMNVMEIPRTRCRLPKLNMEYWKYRYYGDAIFNSKYEYLARRMHHPLYLSHWTVDLEGINMLNKEQPE